MHAKLADLEIPSRLIDSVMGSDGMVYIRGQAVREEDRKLISELSGMKLGDVVTFEATNRFGNTIGGSGEIRSIDIKEAMQNYHTIMDFRISLKSK